MKHIIIITLSAIMLASCGQKENELAILRLRSENNHLVSAVANRATQIDQMKTHLNEVHKNIRAIREREMLISELTESGELISNAESIFADIEAVGNLIRENKWLIADLQDQIALGDAEMQEYKLTIDLLSEQLSDRTEKLKSLVDQLVEKDIAIASLEHYQLDLLCELEEKEVSSNTVIFTYGTFEELKMNDVVEKQGGVLGLGANKVLSANFNKDYFTVLDKREIIEIPLLCKEADLVSLHPEGSYEFVGDPGQVALHILDQDKFWETSKYLTVMIK